MFSFSCFASIFCHPSHVLRFTIFSSFFYPSLLHRPTHLPFCPSTFPFLSLPLSLYSTPFSSFSQNHKRPLSLLSISPTYLWQHLFFSSLSLILLIIVIFLFFSRIFILFLISSVSSDALLSSFSFSHPPVIFSS
jgi:hypothetical protein